MPTVSDQWFTQEVVVPEPLRLGGLSELGSAVGTDSSSASSLGGCLLCMRDAVRSQYSRERPEHRHCRICLSCVHDKALRPLAASKGIPRLRPYFTATALDTILTVNLIQSLGFQLRRQRRFSALYVSYLVSQCCHTSTCSRQTCLATAAQQLLVISNKYCSLDRFHSIASI